MKIFLAILSILSIVGCYGNQKTEYHNCGYSLSYWINGKQFGIYTGQGGIKDEHECIRRARQDQSLLEVATGRDVKIVHCDFDGLTILTEKDE